MKICANSIYIYIYHWKLFFCLILFARLAHYVGLGIFDNMWKTTCSLWIDRNSDHVWQWLNFMWDHLQWCLPQRLEKTWLHAMHGFNLRCFFPCIYLKNFKDTNLSDIKSVYWDLPCWINLFDLNYINVCTHLSAPHWARSFTQSSPDRLALWLWRHLAKSSCFRWLKCDLDILKVFQIYTS